MYEITMKEEFMRRAIQLARNGMRAGDGGPFGAVIVRDTEIIGEGGNRVLATNNPPPTARSSPSAMRARKPAATLWKAA